jgi:hypothetical protein
MKSKILTLLLISFLSVIAVSAQTNVKKISPVGTWKFDAPYAPAGYNSGSITVALEDKKYTTSMEFTGTQAILKGEKVKVVNDSIFFSVYVEAQDVSIKLKIEDASKMTGKAVYTEGEVPLTLNRNDKTEVKAVGSK